MIALLRHGDTGFTGFRGSLDDALTPLGWQQMEAACAGHGWAHIVSSPRQRCAAFARQLAAAHHCPLALDDRLTELHFGDWEGQTAAELMTRDADALGRFWQDPDRHPPPGGETMSRFSQRVLAVWRELACVENCLVITHGGVIRRILCEVRGLPLSQLLTLEVPHASLHRIGA